MPVTTEQIKSLRDQTGISIAQCKLALEKCGGDLTQAVTALREAGAVIAGKKAGRQLGAGTVSAYVHTGGGIGALVLLQSETDFVAKNPEFKALADDLAMQLAAMPAGSPDELLSQPFIKDPTLTVADLIKTAVQKFGERIEVANFTRLDVNDAGATT